MFTDSQHTVWNTTSIKEVQPVFAFTLYIISWGCNCKVNAITNRHLARRKVKKTGKSTKQLAQKYPYHYPLVMLTLRQLMLQFCILNIYAHPPSLTERLL